jgi:hypothetical protein
MNSNKDSTIFCHELGISFAFEQAKLYNMKVRAQAKLAKSDEFVKEKSKPKFIGIILMIVNCSSGEKNIRF